MTDRIVEVSGDSLKERKRQGYSVSSTNFQRKKAEMEWNLYTAAITGNVELLEETVKKDCKILKRVGVECLKQSPLHVAVSHGYNNFVRKLLELSPELAEAIDSRRRSPLHLASAKGYLEIVKELVPVSRDMCTSRDIDGRNPLHVAAMNGEGDVLEYLASECPQAARARTDRGETILHLSFKYNHMEALELLLDHNECQDLVNAKDDDGNTILHLAVANHNYQVVKHLLVCDKINASPTNADGNTPLDMVIEIETKLKMDEIAHQTGRSKPKKVKKNMSFWHSQKSNNILCSDALRHAEAQRAEQLGKVKWLTRKRDSLMVVASLIATMAFQAGVSPPGGVWQDDSNGHRAGETVMAYNYPNSFPYFLRLNTVGLVGSLSTILLLISELPFKRKVFMWILVVIMWLTITSMAFTYSFAITVVTPKSHRESLSNTIKIGVIVWSSVMAVLLLVHTVRLLVKVIKEAKMKHYVSKSLKKNTHAEAAAAEAVATTNSAREAPTNV